MAGLTSQPIEEFLEAVTAQLDKTQDALRLKAINRPLTFALRDFSIDLNVFIEMNQQGDILFRPAGPNETGASTVKIGFTTITRSMIEENTVSMELTQSPTLEEVGLDSNETRALQRLGVRNAAQLRRLEASAGDNTMSRLSGVNVDRLRVALQKGQPTLRDIVDDSGQTSTDGVQQDGSSITVPGRLRLRPGQRRLALRGDNLIDGGLPTARFNGRPLQVLQATPDTVTLGFPEPLNSNAIHGEIEVQLPGQDSRSFAVEAHDDNDPWLPVEEQ